MKEQPQPIIKSLAVGGLAILFVTMANSVSATTIAPPEYWEEEERPTSFEIQVVPIPEMPEDADLPEYVPTLEDFIPCRWFVPIIPIQQEGRITGYRSGTPECLPELQGWRRDW